MGESHATRYPMQSLPLHMWERLIITLYTALCVLTSVIKISIMGQYRRTWSRSDSFSASDRSSYAVAICRSQWSYEIRGNSTDSASWPTHWACMYFCQSAQRSCSMAANFSNNSLIGLALTVWITITILEQINHLIIPSPSARHKNRACRLQ